MNKKTLFVFFILLAMALAVAFFILRGQGSTGMVASPQGKSERVGYSFSMPFSVTGDCTDFTKHGVNENWYPDEDYSGSAHARAEIRLSRIYGNDCTDNPFKDFAKIRVSCEGYSKTQGPLYLYRLDPNDDWDDAKQEINCNEYGCVGEDRAFSSGSHTITLRDRKGEMDSIFFICYDYDESSRYWAWTWKGWGFWGHREVYESHTDKKCSDGDVYWYDSKGDREEIYEDCSQYEKCENERCKLKDSDEDGIPDKDDECPNKAGIERYDGCPEPEGESILDFLGKLVGV